MNTMKEQIFNADSRADSICILEQLKKNKLIVENMTSKELLQLFEYVDLLFNSFVSKLKKNYELNEKNLILAILIRLDFSSTDLANIFQCEKASILKKKQRLKNKLYLDRDDDLFFFLSHYPF